MYIKDTYVWSCRRVGAWLAGIEQPVFCHKSTVSWGREDQCFDTDTLIMGLWSVVLCSEPRPTMTSVPSACHHVPLQCFWQAQLVTSNTDMMVPCHWWVWCRQPASCPVRPCSHVADVCQTQTSKTKQPLSHLESFTQWGNFVKTDCHVGSHCIRLLVTVTSFDHNIQQPWWHVRCWKTQKQKPNLFDKVDQSKDWSVERCGTPFVKFSEEIRSTWFGRRRRRLSSRWVACYFRVLDGSLRRCLRHLRDRYVCSINLHTLVALKSRSNLLCVHVCVCVLFSFRNIKIN